MKPIVCRYFFAQFRRRRLQGETKLGNRKYGKIVNLQSALRRHRIEGANLEASGTRWRDPAHQSWPQARAIPSIEGGESLAKA
jgi:hypothetical protein